MGRLIANVNLTLDSVMQAPGRPDEDARGGFEHGGWATPYFDPTSASVANERVPVKVLHSDRNGDRIEGLSSGRLEG